VAESFEEHLEALERLVEQLESGELTLDESLRSYQDGVQRLKACYGLLRDAEGKVTILARDADGELVEKPFDESLEEGA